MSVLGLCASANAMADDTGKVGASTRTEASAKLPQPSSRKEPCCAGGLNEAFASSGRRPVFQKWGKPSNPLFALEEKNPSYF